MPRKFPPRDLTYRADRLFHEIKEGLPVVGYQTFMDKELEAVASYQDDEGNVLWLTLRYEKNKESERDV